MNKTQQGDIGVSTAILHYTRQKNIVSVPNSEQCKYDLVVDRDGKLFRVQVKTCNSESNGGYEVGLRTNGANYTTKNNHTKISQDAVDLVFILIGTGEAFELPVSLVHEKSTITLGTEKYKSYSVGFYPAL